MTMSFKSLDRLQKQLERLGKKGARRAMRRATRSATAVLAKAVKSEVPVDEGLLRKAMSYKVSGRGLKMSGIVGADVAKLQADNASDATRPTNIDHLVNDGHVAPGGTFIPPDGFMQRGAEKGMPAAERKYIDTLEYGLEIEARRK
jgi:hypothetical protein